MELPLANATLTKITAGGQSADYDVDAGDGDPKWEGEEAIYFQEEEERVSGGDGSDLIVSRSIFVLTERFDIEFEADDVVTYTLERNDAEVVEEVKRVRRDEYPGVPGCVRLHLEDG